MEFSNLNQSLLLRPHGSGSCCRAMQAMASDADIASPCSYYLNLDRSGFDASFPSTTRSICDPLGEIPRQLSQNQVDNA